MNEHETNDTLASEIGEAIKTMNAEQTVEEKGAATEVVAKETSVETAPEASVFAADDALIERAVKAGLSVADAKAFANADQADRILKALESKKETPTTEEAKPANGEGEGFPADAFDKVLKEMEADGDYDPKFVALFKQMGSALKDQANTIKALKSAGASAAAENAFDKSYGNLDKAVRDHVDAATKSQLKKKYDFLKAAHASAKDGATDQDVFDEARKLVLGGIESQYAEEDKAAAIAKRKSLALARPGGESGQRGTDKPMTEEDIANALFQQMTK